MMLHISLLLLSHKLISTRYLVILRYLTAVATTDYDTQIWLLQRVQDGIDKNLGASVSG